MENVLVIGQGEIGKPFADFIESTKKFNVYRKDIEPLKLEEKIDVLHICLPGDDSKKFIKWTCDYIKEYNPVLTVNNSTVVPGTTDEIYKQTGALIVHSPYRGGHKVLSDHIKKYDKFIGPASPKAGELAVDHFKKLGIPHQVLSSAKASEFGKLWDTTYYAMNIVCAQEAARLCRIYGVSYEEAVDAFNKTFIMDKFFRDEYKRPVLFPGYISGHCLIPNAKMLYHDLFKHNYCSEFLEAIFNSNKKRAEEEGREDNPTREEN